MQRIPGRKDAAISSLAFCLASKECPQGKLFSAGLDGNLIEWDLKTLRQKVSPFTPTPDTASPIIQKNSPNSPPLTWSFESQNVQDCYGGSVWAMAVRPVQSVPEVDENGTGPSSTSSDSEGFSSDSEEDFGGDDGEEDLGVSGSFWKFPEEQELAVGCDDGCVRVFRVSREGTQFKRAFPTVQGTICGTFCQIVQDLIFPSNLSPISPQNPGKILSLAWNPSGTKLFAGGSDG